MSRTRMHVWTSLRGLGIAREPMSWPQCAATRRGTRRELGLTGRLRAVALLEFLAGAAPARIVAADLLGRVDPALLDDRERLVGLDGVAVGPHRGAGATRGLRERARMRGPHAARVRDLAGPGRAAAGSDARPRLVLLRRAAVLALHLDLDVEDHPREVRPDGVHQIGEELERLVLVGDDRFDLGEPAQVDALAQVVHVVEVLAPAVVDDLQEQEALQRAHELVAELGLAAVVEPDGVLREAIGEIGAVEVLGRDRRTRKPRREDVL